ncbi:Rv0361 family membrane protein [Rhodococcus aetherivorans]|uniref:Rv0361 family membrane protein n=1 Tax=Rhodococcus aetherivorans TaxID=191292 RepID=UPI00365713B7
MAAERAPEPDPDETDRSSATPFLAALAIIVVLVVGVFVAQLVSPSDSSTSGTELVVRTVDDYVRAHNAGDAPAQDRLRCDGLPADRAPLAGVAGEVQLEGVENVETDGDRGTADVRARFDGNEQTSTWQFVRIDDVWRVCTF